MESTKYLLKMEFHMESADHDGYCSGGEGEYDSEYFTVIIPVPASLDLSIEGRVGEYIPLSEFKKYDFKEVIEYLRFAPRLVELLNEFDKNFYGIIRFRLRAGQSGYCDRSNLPKVFSDEGWPVRMCNTDYIQLVKAQIIKE